MTERIKIAFLGAKEIGAYCLEHLLKSASELSLDVVAIRTRSGKNGEKIARLAKEYSVPLLSSLDELPEVDILYSVQHHELLRQQDIDKAHRIAVNLHLAPLPEYRGCNQFSFAIMEDAEIFGVTIHQMDVRIDHGGILFETRFPVPENIWVNELHQLTVEKGKELFVNSLPLLTSGDYNINSQIKITDRGVSRLYYRHQIETLKNIPLDLPQKEIEKRIRATMMPGFEPPYTMITGKKIYFSDKIS